MLCYYNPTWEPLPLHPPYSDTAEMQDIDFSPRKIDLLSSCDTRDYRNSSMSYCVSDISCRKCTPPEAERTHWKNRQKSTNKILTKLIMNITANVTTITIIAIVPSSVVSGNAFVGCDLLVVPKNRSR